MLRRYIIFFGLIHAMVMLGTTIWASMQSSILQQGHLFSEPWFIATLIDTYLAFLLFYLWIALTTRGNIIRMMYFVLVVTLGNISMGLMIAWRAYRMHQAMTWIQFLKGDVDA